METQRARGRMSQREGERMNLPPTGPEINQELVTSSKPLKWMPGLRKLSLLSLPFQAHQQACI